VRGPTDAELSELSAKLEGRVTRWLRKKGLLLAERQSVQAEPDALEQATQTALRLGQLAHVDERGQAVSLPTRRPGRNTGTGAHAGYSLHASTVVAAGDREGLERLLRYCARPALSLERLRETKDGRYAYELRYPSLGHRHDLHSMQRMRYEAPNLRSPVTLFFREHGSPRGDRRHDGLAAWLRSCKVLQMNRAEEKPCRRESPLTQHPCFNGRTKLTRTLKGWSNLWR
jgi:hypothetical protein